MQYRPVTHYYPTTQLKNQRVIPPLIEKSVATTTKNPSNVSNHTHFTRTQYILQNVIIESCMRLLVCLCMYITVCAFTVEQRSCFPSTCQNTPMKRGAERTQFSSERNEKSNSSLYFFTPLSFSLIKYQYLPQRS